MGITPIEYRPWDGKRTEHYRRFLVISKNIFRQKLKSKWILAILIIGIILTHVFTIIFISIFPHEELSPVVMVGEEQEDPVIEIPVEEGANLNFNGIATLNGTLYLEGDIYGYGTVSGLGEIYSGLIPTDSGFLYVTHRINITGRLNLTGRISGNGFLEGDFTVSSLDFAQIERPFMVEGSVRLKDQGSERSSINLNGNLIGKGSFTGDGTPVSDMEITQNGTITLEGTAALTGELEMAGNFTGTGLVSGPFYAYGAPITKEPDGGSTVVIERIGGYLTNGALVIFTILLASLICSDLVASDLGDNSFILFFSRPIKTADYMMGKILGALWVLGLFTFLPLIIFCIAVMGTQSGDDFRTSLNVLGSTTIAGLLTTFIFIPYGIFISSLTKRKSYATIGIFMSFFVLTIIAQIFSSFDPNWLLIDPNRMLNYSYYVLYGYTVPQGINGSLHGIALLLFMVVPLIMVYLRIHLKGAGK